MSDLGLSSSCATPADAGAALGMASEAMSRLLGAADNVYSFVPKPSSLRFFSHGWGAVSYTHLTLPTICSV